MQFAKHSRVYVDAKMERFNLCWLWLVLISDGIEAEKEPILHCSEFNYVKYPFSTMLFSRSLLKTCF